MKEIYLISSDGYRDSIDLSNFATNTKGIIALIKNDLSIIGYKLIESSVEIDYFKQSIFYNAIEPDKEIYKGTYYLHLIKNIE